MICHDVKTYRYYPKYVMSYHQVSDGQARFLPCEECICGELFCTRLTEKIFAEKSCVLVTTPFYLGTYDLRTYWKGFKVKVGNHTKIANSENNQKSKTPSLISP